MTEALQDLSTLAQSQPELQWLNAVESPCAQSWFSIIEGCHKLNSRDRLEIIDKLEAQLDASWDDRLRHISSELSHCLGLDKSQNIEYLKLARSQSFLRDLAPDLTRKKRYTEAMTGLKAIDFNETDLAHRIDLSTYNYLIALSLVICESKRLGEILETCVNSLEFIHFRFGFLRETSIQILASSRHHLSLQCLLFDNGVLSTEDLETLSKSWWPELRQLRISSQDFARLLQHNAAIDSLFPKLEQLFLDCHDGVQELLKLSESVDFAQVFGQLQMLVYQGQRSVNESAQQFAEKLPCPVKFEAVYDGVSKELIESLAYPAPLLYGLQLTSGELTELFENGAFDGGNPWHEPIHLRVDSIESARQMVRGGALCVTLESQALIERDVKDFAALRPFELIESNTGESRDEDSNEDTDEIAGDSNEVDRGDEQPLTLMERIAQFISRTVGAKTETATGTEAAIESTRAKVGPRLPATAGRIDWIRAQAQLLGETAADSIEIRVQSFDRFTHWFFIALSDALAGRPLKKLKLVFCRHSPYFDAAKIQIESILHSASDEEHEWLLDYLDPNYVVHDGPRRMQVTNMAEHLLENIVTELIEQFLSELRAIDSINTEVLEIETHRLMADRLSELLSLQLFKVQKTLIAHNVEHPPEFNILEIETYQHLKNLVLRGYVPNKATIENYYRSEHKSLETLSFLQSADQREISLAKYYEYFAPAPELLL